MVLFARDPLDDPDDQRSQTPVRFQLKVEIHDQQDPLLPQDAYHLPQRRDATLRFHFVNRHAGLRVADLLGILNITKQSLGRVLKQLIDQGYIIQQAGASDRRERLLFATERGQALAERLAAPQLVRLSRALKAAGPGAETTLHQFLEAMINVEDRPQVSSIMSASSPQPGRGGTGEGS